jgi:hypothetical protein
MEVIKANIVKHQEDNNINLDKEVHQREDNKHHKTHNALSAELMETAFQIQTPSVLPESMIILTKTKWRVKDTVEPKVMVKSQAPIPVLTLTRVLPSQDSQIFTRILREFKIVTPSNAEERRLRALVAPRKLSPSRVKSKSAKPPMLEPATNLSPPLTQLVIMIKRSLPVLETHVSVSHQ